MALSSSICDCLCLLPLLSFSQNYPHISICCVLRLKLISCRNVNAVNVLPPLLPFNFYMTTHCSPTSAYLSAHLAYTSCLPSLLCQVREQRAYFAQHSRVCSTKSVWHMGHSLGRIVCFMDQMIACSGGLSWFGMPWRRASLGLPGPGPGQGCYNVSASGEHEFAFQHAT